MLMIIASIFIMVYGELGRYPLSVTIKKRITGYWGRLVEGKEGKFSQIGLMFDYLLSLYIRVALGLQVKQILDDCGLSYLWITQK